MTLLKDNFAKRLQVKPIHKVTTRVTHHVYEVLDDKSKVRIMKYSRKPLSKTEADSQLDVIKHLSHHGIGAKLRRYTYYNNRLATVTDKMDGTLSMYLSSQRSKRQLASVVRKLFMLFFTCAKTGMMLSDIKPDAIGYRITKGEPRLYIHDPDIDLCSFGTDEGMTNQTKRSVQILYARMMCILLTEHMKARLPFANPPPQIRKQWKWFCKAFEEYFYKRLSYKSIPKRIKIGDNHVHPIEVLYSCLEPERITFRHYIAMQAVNF